MTEKKIPFVTTRLNSKNKQYINLYEKKMKGQLGKCRYPLFLDRMTNTDRKIHTLQRSLQPSDRHWKPPMTVHRKGINALRLNQASPTFDIVIVTIHKGNAQEPCG